jgi:hypothetical protein
VFEEKMARAAKTLKKTGSNGATPIEAVAQSPLGDERIRARAYELYLERGDRPGNDVEDWLRAEREVTVRAQDAKRS